MRTSNRGAMEIEVEFEGLDKPTSFGTEYLTYVMWAISPEGRSVNMGEVLVGGNHRSKLDATTDLQTFALIVTAEPYYAVHRPSNVVIAENLIRPDTVGTSEAAVRIAKSAGAEIYAAPSYQKAVSQMKRADELGTAKHVDKKVLISASREVVQTADDSREIAVKRIDANRTNADKNSEAAKLANAEAATGAANRRSVRADQATAEAQRQQRNAEADSDRNRAATADANQATVEAQQGQRNAEAESERNRLAAADSDEQRNQAVRGREALRAELLQQFNVIFTTRDTARGLIVSLSDVLFDTGKSTLHPAARERLAKISGIVLAYPTLRLAIEGHTDSVGSDELNQQLSEDRAGSVRDYLASQSIPAASMTSQGFGKMQPVASNDTAEGRQQNRRVELVVSGQVIGTDVGTLSLDTPLPVRP
jgi:outer membrane protein OmpA-like peptidoglycan-associated protein